MKTFKKIIFLILIANSTSSITFGMQQNSLNHEKTNLQEQPSNEQEKDLAQKLFELENSKNEFSNIMQQLNDKFTKLYSILLESHEEALQFLMDAIPLNQRFAFFMAQPNNTTILQKAVILGLVEKVRILIQKMPEEQRFPILMAREKSGMTMLCLVLFANKIDIKAKAELFKIFITALPKGQKTDFIMARDANERTILHYIAMFYALGQTPFDVETSKKCLLDLASILINALPENQRISFVKIKDEKLATAKQYAEATKNTLLTELLKKYDKSED